MRRERRKSLIVYLLSRRAIPESASAGGDRTADGRPPQTKLALGDLGAAALDPHGGGVPERRSPRSPSARCPGSAPHNAPCSTSHPNMHIHMACRSLALTFSTCIHREWTTDDVRVASLAQRHTLPGARALAADRSRTRRTAGSTEHGGHTPCPSHARASSPPTHILSQGRRAGAAFTRMASVPEELASSSDDVVGNAVGGSARPPPGMADGGRGSAPPRPPEPAAACV